MPGPLDSGAARFKRSLLALADVRLRLDWLEAQVQSEPVEILARLLDVVIGESEISEPRAREALVTIALWVAGTARESDLARLRQTAFEQRLLSLQRVIRRVPSESQAPGPSQAHIPDYGTGRELTLGERRSLARRSDRQGFYALLRDPDPMVIRELLTNPKTTEDDVVRIAAHRPARPTSIEAIARTRWLTRGRVRMSVLQNPGSPPNVALPLVGLCTRTELLQLARGADVPTIVRITASELAQRRAPLWGPEAQLGDEEGDDAEDGEDAGSQRILQ
jgi:hypothetical protein